MFKDGEIPTAPKHNPNYTVSIWAAISRKGKIALKVYNGILDRFKYLNLI